MRISSARILLLYTQIQWVEYCHYAWMTLRWRHSDTFSLFASQLCLLFECSSRRRWLLAVVVRFESGPWYDFWWTKRFVWNLSESFSFPQIFVRTATSNYWYGIFNLLQPSASFNTEIDEFHRRDRRPKIEQHDKRKTQSKQYVSNASTNETIRLDSSSPWTQTDEHTR